MVVDSPKLPRDWDELPFLSESIQKRLRDVFETSFGPKRRILQDKIKKGRSNQEPAILQPRLVFLFGPQDMGVRDIVDVIKERIQSGYWDAHIYNDGENLNIFEDLNKALSFAATRERPIFIFLGDMDSIPRGPQDTYDNWENIIRFVVNASQNATKNVTLVWWCTSPDIQHLSSDMCARLRNASECIMIMEPEDLKTYEHWITDIMKDQRFTGMKKLNVCKFAPICDGLGYYNIYDAFEKVTRKTVGDAGEVTEQQIEDELFQQARINWNDFQGAAVKLGAPPPPRPLPTRTWDEIVGLDAAKITFYYMWEKIKQGKGSKFNAMMLWGTPGCGKTEFGTIVADISGFEPIITTGNKLIKGYVGQTEGMVNNFFDDIESKAEKTPVIVFLDEAEKVMVARDANIESAHVFDRDAVNTLISRLGGAKPLKNVIFIASTNLPEAIDDAVKRRFVYKVFVGPPNQKGYKKLWKTFLEKRAAENDLKITISDTEYDQLAKSTSGKFLPSKINGPHGMIDEIIESCEHGVIDYDLCMSIVNNKNPGEDQATIRKYMRRRAELPDNIPITRESILTDFIKIHGQELCITATAPEILELEAVEQTTPVFKDVVNLSFEKVNIYLICEKLLDANEWKKLKKEQPPVLLLWGPPGTGKTYLIRAATNTFTSRQGTKIRFHQIPAGETLSAEDLSKIFEKAENSAPSILFIDEAERLLPDEAMNPFKTDVVSRYLELVDGVEKHESRIFIVLATNKPEQLDKSVMSRSFAALYFPLPSREMRRQLWERVLTDHLEDIDLSDVDYAAITDEAEGVSPRNIVSDICPKLRLKCIVTNRKKITTSDIMKLLSKVQRETDLSKYEELLNEFDNPVVSREDVNVYLSQNPKIRDILGCDPIVVIKDPLGLKAKQENNPPPIKHPPIETTHLLKGFNWYTIELSRYAEISEKDVIGFGIQLSEKKLKGKIKLWDGEKIHSFEEELQFFVKRSLPKGTVLLPNTFMRDNRQEIKPGRQKLKLDFLINQIKKIEDSTDLQDQLDDGGI